MKSGSSACRSVVDCRVPRPAPAGLVGVRRGGSSPPPPPLARRRMRIGFFTDTFRPNLNGVVVSIETFAAEIDRLGSTVVLFAPRAQLTELFSFGRRGAPDLPPGL